MPGRGPARCRSPSRCPLSCSGPAPAAMGGADRSMSDHIRTFTNAKCAKNDECGRFGALSYVYTLRTTPQLTGASLCPRP